MLQQLFGTELSSPMRIIIALIIIAALLGITVALFRRLSGGSRAPVARGRQGPRLAVLDTVAVDPKRRLVLVRRDSTEHLLLIGGSNDVVVESQIPASQEDETIREALPPQRGPRRVTAAVPAVLAGTASVEALAAPAAEVALPAAELDPVPAAEPEAERSLRRRPLLRADGTLSGRERPLAVGPRAPDAIAETAPRAEAAAHAMPAPRREASVAADELELPAEPRQVAPEVPDEAPAGRPDPRLDDMARRLDAALTRPAAPEPEADTPKLELSDLLDQPPEVPAAEDAEPAPVVRPERNGTARPAMERPVERTPVPPPERPAPPAAPERIVGRPARGIRQQPRPAPEPRIRAEAPRIEAGRPDRGAASAIMASPRPPAGGREPPMRLREFSLRPAAPSLPVPPREPVVELRPPAEPVKEPPTVERDAPEMALPVAAPPANDSIPAVELASEPEKSEAKASDTFTIALDEFDTEMASLLGRTSSRSH